MNNITVAEEMMISMMKDVASKQDATIEQLLIIREALEKINEGLGKIK